MIRAYRSGSAPCPISGSNVSFTMEIPDHITSTATTSPAIASILTERKWQINVEAIVALVVITSPMESADVASITFD